MTGARWRAMLGAGLAMQVACAGVVGSVETDAGSSDATPRVAPMDAAAPNAAPGDAAPADGGPTMDAATVDAATIGDAMFGDATVDDAMIVDATVDDAMIVDATVDDAMLVDATVDAAMIVDATVDDAMIADARIADAAVVADGGLTLDAAASDAAALDAAVAVDSGPPPPPPLGCTSGSNSAFSTMACTMPAGSWARLSVSNQNEILGVGDHSGSMLHYAHNCAWNPMTGSIEIVGADHNYGATMRYVRYDLPSNQFVLLNVGGNASDSGTAAGHEFCGTAVNPSSGDTYYRHYAGLGVGTFTVTRAPLGATAFSEPLPATPQLVVNIVAGTVWWSGPFPGLGAEGGLFTYNAGNSVPGGSANDGQILAYDPTTNAWIQVIDQGASPFYALNGGSTYHEIASYSRMKNVMVYGGGNEAPEKLWKLDQTGATTRLTDVPSGKAVGIQRGNLREDPVGGNFLLLSAGELWELAPEGTGSWTRQTGSREPPAAVGQPGPSTIDGIVSCAIPEYGVIVYLKQTTSTDSAFHLYKHN